MPYSQPWGSPYDTSIPSIYKAFDLGATDSFTLSTYDVPDYKTVTTPGTPYLKGTNFTTKEDRSYTRAGKDPFLCPHSNKPIKPCLKYPSTRRPVKSKSVRFRSTQLETVRLFRSTERPIEIHGKVPLHKYPFLIQILETYKSKNISCRNISPTAGYLFGGICSTRILVALFRR